jgi:hypothetical protein
MNRAYLNASASFDTALIELVKQCRRDLWEIKYHRDRMNGRLEQAAVVHGIDPAAVRRLLKVLVQSDGNDDINHARQQEIDAAYKAIVSGAVPVVSRRMDTELDKVMELVTDGKPPKISAIRKAIACSAGKASKLRGLAAARLAAKSSSSPKERENEIREQIPVAVTPPALSMAEPESVSAPVDTSNVVSLPRSN